MYRTFLIVASLVLFLTGCAAAEGDVVEFWAMGREGEVVQELVAEFEREHPGIRVRVQQIPWIAAHEKLLTAFAGDATPDICQLGNTWVPEFAALGALENLGPWVRTSAVIDSSDYFSGIWDTNVIDGQLYGIPWYVDTRLLFYRKDLLREAGFEGPPQTWDEWLTAMERIKANVGEDNYAILVPINEFEPPLILGLQTGASMLREGDRYGNFEAERFRKAFEFYVHLFENGLAPVQGTTQISNLYQEFARGYFAMYITGPWNIGEFQRRLPAEQQDDWMTAPLPGPDSLGVSTAGGASLVLFRDSEQKEAA